MLTDFAAYNPKYTVTMLAIPILIPMLSFYILSLKGGILIPTLSKNRKAFGLYYL